MGRSGPANIQTRQAAGVHSHCPVLRTRQALIDIAAGAGIEHRPGTVADAVVDRDPEGASSAGHGSYRAILG